MRALLDIAALAAIGATAFAGPLDLATGAPALVAAAYLVLRWAPALAPSPRRPDPHAEPFGDVSHMGDRQ